jgi:hypothetical protein
MLVYPSYQALRLADQILDAIGEQIPGYRGRLGSRWYWRLNGGILVTFSLDFTITEQRWDVLKAEAVTPNVGAFSAAEFPFRMYGTLLESPPFIHDLEGEAEWSNRLYFQMGHLIEDAARWMETLLAVVLDPQIRTPSSFPTLTQVERDMVNYALDELNGRFVIKTIHEVFEENLSYRAVARVAQHWEDLGLLTEHPRRVTIALRALVEQGASPIDHPEIDEELA